MEILPGRVLPFVELRKPSPHDLASGDEARPQVPEVGRKVMVLYQLSNRFHGLEAEMVEQRLTQIQADIQTGFPWQNFQHSLNC
jgi:hypothetical protein